MKWIKAIGITLVSLVAVLLMAAGVLVYVVFTPDRLTPVVRQVAGSFISSEYHIGRVELTFFSTFPEFGLRANGLDVINPTEGAPSDTLLSAREVVARIDLMSLLREGNLAIREVSLEEVTLQAYIDAEGHTNYDVLTLESDTAVADTTDSFLRSMSLEDMHVGLTTSTLRFVSERDSVDVEAKASSLLFTAAGDEQQVEGELDIKLTDLTATLGDTRYTTDAQIAIELPFRGKLAVGEGLSLTEADLMIDRAMIGLNRIHIGLSGHLAVLPRIEMDLQLAGRDAWDLSYLLEQVPASLFTMPEGIAADMKLGLAAHVYGVYDSVSMPLIDATLSANDGRVRYDSLLPAPLEELSADLTLHVDLNSDSLINVAIASLRATLGSSHFRVCGDVCDVLHDMALDLDLKGNVEISDVASFLPAEYPLEGSLPELDMHLSYRLSDLMTMRLKHGRLHGSVAGRDLRLLTDSMQFRLPEANLMFCIPAEKVEHKETDWLSGVLRLDSLYFNQLDGPRAKLSASEIRLALSDILSDNPVIAADLDLDSKAVTADMTLTDSLGQQQPVHADILTPSVCGFVEFDTKDTLRIPTFAGRFSCDKLDARYDTITLLAHEAKGTASMRAGRRNAGEPRLSATVSMRNAAARMSRETYATLDLLDVEVSARHRSGQNHILLEWNPRLKLDIEGVHAHVEGLEPEVIVPDIELQYSNRAFVIDTSRIELGHSDFSLSGEVRNIGKWLRREDLMQGTLHFISDHADINELLAYTSGMGVEDEVMEEPSAKDVNPYMVPKGVDVELLTEIRSASAFGQNLRNLGGKIYVKDGVLIIEEMGFICQAARLRLTAMYKTPRKNHLFAGLDYHMTNVNIAELVDMIPEVDTVLPMLRSFKGRGEFHLAAETYLTGSYDPKPSTMRGAMSLSGYDLTLLDGETFSKIAKILTFKRSTENRIDSISAVATLYKKELDVYPFMIAMDRWHAAVGGSHNLDGNFNYHISLLTPLRIGVDVKGTMDDLHIKPAKCRYKDEFLPAKQIEIQTETQNIRKLIQEALINH